ncbi:MAG: hypothetical protein U9R27_01515 [Campylobacterota bacterium]|nr:hypothetical protein [Campylobacterota bacterium]
MFYEEDESIEIVYKKYILLSEGALKTLCSKYDINFFFGATKRELATNIIPDTIVSEGYLEHFYSKLTPREQKILKYIVNHRGGNLRAAVKKKFKFDIVSMTRGPQMIYVWWLELFIDQNEMDEVLRYYFFRFLGDDTLIPNKKETPPIPAKHPDTTKDINSIKIHKVDGDFMPLSQKLIVEEPQDIVSIVRFFYRLAKDSKLKITQKGTLTVRSRRFIEESISADPHYYIWLINFLLDIQYLTKPQLKLPTKAFDSVIMRDDGKLIQALFDKYVAHKMQQEFNFVIFDIDATSGKDVAKFRKTLLETIANLNSDEWISIDFFTEEIPLTNKVITQISNGYPYCYNFEHDYRRRRDGYNQLKDLKMVVRYFIKSFVGIASNFGLFTLATTAKESFIADELKRSDGYYNRPFINIEYIKLTKLGRFVLGLEKSFAEESNFTLKLNPYAFEITVDNPSSRSELLLSPMATQITEHKYQTTLKKLMNIVDTAQSFHILKEELLSKCESVPENWQRLFDTIERRIDSITIVSRSAILIEIKNPKEIQGIIASHPKLQEKILKADKLHIVVLKDDLTYVKKVLKEHGAIV